MLAFASVLCALDSSAVVSCVLALTRFSRVLRVRVHISSGGRKNMGRWIDLCRGELETPRGLCDGE